MKSLNHRQSGCTGKSSLILWNDELDDIRPTSWEKANNSRSARLALRGCPAWTSTSWTIIARNWLFRVGTHLSCVLAFGALPKMNKSRTFHLLLNGFLWQQCLNISLDVSTDPSLKWCSSNCAALIPFGWLLNQGRPPGSLYLSHYPAHPLHRRPLNYIIHSKSASINMFLKYSSLFTSFSPIVCLCASISRPKGSQYVGCSFTSMKIRLLKLEKNIARITNAVQVTLWLSITNPQCHDSSFQICQ